MVNELAEERHASGMGWIVSVDQTEIGIRYQRHRACRQIVVRIHNPARTTQLHKSVANRIRWRCERSANYGTFDQNDRSALDPEAVRR